ncbi:MAG TPA: methylmalonyl Co-A mutase-associated GTPase MeaB [Acidimicrobiia bacterium]|nr:methylmalonyl Co-A mutase-associated GTPase MeaB [Acidimicrobiia bacterium]
MSSSELIDLVRTGDRAALARLVTAIESGEPDVVEAVGTLSREGQSARRIGVTGPPGAGKSTLISAIITELRSRSLSVAVLAVDPSSPLTGGALLGDRIRMQGHVEDDGVYIRSMATRGHLGGLAAAAGSTIDILSNAGFDFVLVETVGVGQSEIEVMNLVEVVVLVVGPGWGDQIQAEKAGVIEIADLFVVNKADRPGVDEVRHALLGAAGESGSEVLTTTALTGEGVGALVDAIEKLVGR